MLCASVSSIERTHKADLLKVAHRNRPARLIEQTWHRPIRVGRSLAPCRRPRLGVHARFCLSENRDHHSAANVCSIGPLIPAQIDQVASAMPFMHP